MHNLADYEKQITGVTLNIPNIVSKMWSIYVFFFNLQRCEVLFAEIKKLNGFNRLVVFNGFSRVVRVAK